MNGIRAADAAIPRYDAGHIPQEVSVRTFVLNHLIHHRGQLEVYLRMNDVPLPAIYGPSADEGGM